MDFSIVSNSWASINYLSSLVNQLLGSNVCPHSQKVHTTRTNALGILTKDSTQVVIKVRT